MKITGVESFSVEVPQKPPIAPYHSRYRGQSTTKSILIRLETDSGVVGWGETPQVYLGDPTDLTQKWSAAVAVLSDSGSAGAAYIDVSDPRRPAAGAGQAAASSSSGASSSGSSADSSAGSGISTDTGASSAANGTGGAQNGG